MDILIGQIASAVQLQGFISGEEQLKGSFDLFTLPEHQYEGSYTVTPTESEQVLPTSGRTPLGNITVSPIPSEYIVPSGTISITQNGDTDVTSYATASVDVQPSLQDKSVTVISAGNTDITADASYYGLSTATAFVPSGEASQGTQFGYTSSGTRWRMRGYNNVTTAGWFESGQTQGAWASFYAVPSGTTITPTESSQTVGGNDYMMQGAVTVSPIPSQYIVPSGTVTISQSGNTDVTSYATASVPSASISNGAYIGFGYVGGSFKWNLQPYLDVSAGWVTDGEKTLHKYTYSAISAGTTVTPSTSSQTVGGNEYMMQGAVTVDAIPSNYVGSSIPRYSSSDMYPTPDYSVIAPSGYYESDGVFQVPYETHYAPNISYDSSGLITATHYQESGKLCIGSNTTSNTLQIASASISPNYDNGFTQVGGVKKWAVQPTCDVDMAGWANADTVWGSMSYYDVVPSGTTITPSTSSQTVGGYEYMMEGAVTVNPIPSQYIVPSGNIKLTQSTSTDVKNYATATVSAGSAGTPTASKGAVNNHAISVTPSVTNTTGWITGGNKSGTAVSVSASELVSGDKSITANGNNIDVANYSTVSVNVSGGGGSSVQIGYADVVDIPSATSSISFTGLSGEPTSFIVYYNAALSTPSGTPYKVACLVYDGTNIHGQTITNTNNAQVTYDGSSFSKSYNNGTLTLSSSGAYFQAGDYLIIYSYDGTAENIKTADVQVGSGATSITFTDLEDEPIAWYLIFKSNFSTSSGYQRVIFVTDDDGSVGMAMDSSAHLQTTWTSSYNNGSFTITSNGTNSGGYFHQPGYYQLTYVIDASGNYQTKTVTPTISQQTVTADVGYDALKKVTVNPIPSSYVEPTATKGATTYPASTSDQTIASGTYLTGTQTIKGYAVQSKEFTSNGTYTPDNGFNGFYTVTVNVAGGGSSKNVQVLQSTTRANSSSLTKVIGDLTVSKTGTYDIYWSGGRSNTSTSYTWGTRLYVDGSGYGTENTSWTNNVQSNHLSNVSLTANQKLSVYSRGRSGSYYTFVPMLVIIEV